MISSNSTQKAWYAVYTRFKCESSVQKKLSPEIESYLPMQWVRRRWSDRYKRLHVPLIPCYFFVRMMANQRKLVYRNENVVSILSRHGKPLPIPEKEIEIVRKVENSRAPFEFQLERGKFSLGNRIRISKGPLIGLEGLIHSFINQSKVYIHTPTLNGYFVSDVENISLDYTKIPQEQWKESQFSSR